MLWRSVLTPSMGFLGSPEDLYIPCASVELGDQQAFDCRTRHEYALPGPRGQAELARRLCRSGHGHAHGAVTTQGSRPKVVHGGGRCRRVMSLTQEALEGVLQDTFLSEVRPPVCVCSLTSLTAPNRNITEWRPEHREICGVGPDPASQLLSCLPYQERQVVTLRSTAQGWPSTLGARCPRATGPALEGALRRA